MAEKAWEYGLEGVTCEYAKSQGDAGAEDNASGERAVGREIEDGDIEQDDRSVGSAVWNKYQKKVFTRTIRGMQRERVISLNRSCRLFGISRQSIYQAEARVKSRSAEFEQVKELVRDVRMEMPRIGTRKLYHLLGKEFKEAGVKIGRDALFDYLRSEHLLIRRKKNYTKTTDSKHWLKKHPNLLVERQIKRPEEVFVSDITYVKSRERTHYLALVTDAYSRKIMGYHLSDDMSAENVVRALKMAVKKRIGDKPLIHHSDRGLQYASAVYQNELWKNHITPSMTDGYDCYQNALAERVNGILKQEFLLEICNTGRELELLVRESIDTYNQKRPHLSLSMMTPDLVHEKARESSFTGFFDSN